MNPDFFKQDAVTLAQQLLGKKLIRRVDGMQIETRIVETEAYVGPEDKGCHAYGNKRTKRTETMFREGGSAYIYLIYGMYYCFNVVAANKDKPEAVLIRGVEPLSHLEWIKNNRKIKSKKIADLTNGPGKLCRALQIDKSLEACSVMSQGPLYIEEDMTYTVQSIISSPRINIDYAEEYKDKHWRFYIKDNDFVSQKASSK